MKNETRQRLELRKSILELIERRRAETGLEGLGSSIERLLIEEELSELSESPVAEGELVPVRLRNRNRTA